MEEEEAQDKNEQDYIAPLLALFPHLIIADSYARSGHDHRLMDKVWMRSFAGEGLSCSLKGGCTRCMGRHTIFSPAVFNDSCRADTPKKTQLGLQTQTHKLNRQSPRKQPPGGCPGSGPNQPRKLSNYQHFTWVCYSSICTSTPWELEPHRTHPVVNSLYQVGFGFTECFNQNTMYHNPCVHCSLEAHANGHPEPRASA